MLQLLKMSLRPIIGELKRPEQNNCLTAISRYKKTKLSHPIILFSITFKIIHNNWNLRARGPQDYEPATSSQ